MRRFARDFQRKRLYEWEIRSLRDSDLLLPDGSRTVLDERDACAVVAEVWAVRGPSGSEAPRLRIMGNRGRGKYFPDRHEIRLASRYPATCEAWYIIHETAHAIMESRAVGVLRPAGHGPEFCGLYTELLAEIGGAHLAEIRRSMRDAGLNLAPATEVSR